MNRHQINFKNPIIQTYPNYNIIIHPPQEQSTYNHISYNKTQPPLNQDLRIHQFKIKKCPIKVKHNHKQCKYFHSNMDRRRPIHLVTDQLCSVVNKNIHESNYVYACSDGDNCKKCHSKLQQLYSLEKYKTKFCIHYPNDCINCEYGIYCSFAHKQEEIRIKLIHNFERDTDFYIFYYKTIWCPYSLLDHNRENCVYSHNWQDYRRSPYIHQYQPTCCPQWNHHNFITKYENQCKFHMNCKKCHGMRQYEYHPLNYKINACVNQNKCKKSNICPYYHNIQQKRILSTNIISGLCLYYPRNRKLKQDNLQVNNLLIKKSISHQNSTQNRSDENQQTDSSSENSQNSIPDEIDNKKQGIIQAMIKKLYSIQ